MPLVSVIMPVFNSEKYLDEAILSILNQTYSNFEFIIINDGSTDNSLDIIKRFAVQDKRINYISRENRGLVFSLNEGISYSKGKYIVRMDSDDISLPTRIEKQVNLMEKNPHIGVCGTSVESFDNNLNKRLSLKKTNSSYLKAQLVFSPCFAHPSVIIRKSLLLDNNIRYDESFKNIEDYDLWAKVSDLADFSNIREVLLRYRVLETSITRTANNDRAQRYQTSKRIFDYFLKDLNLNNSSIESEIHFQLSSNTWLRNTSLNLNDVSTYLNKIETANEKYNKFSKINLKRVMGKRWIFLGYYKKDIKIIFSKYFYYGILDLMLVKLSF